MQLKVNQDRYVLEADLPLLLKKIEKINEKLKIAKAPLIEMSVGDPHVRDFPSGMYFGALPVLTVVKVEMSRAVEASMGEVKVLAVTKVDNTTLYMEHKTFAKLTPEQDEKIRLAESPCLCEHCNTNRKRAYLYTLETPDGLKRVGSGCVEGFTGFNFKLWHGAYEKALDALDQFVEIDFNKIQTNLVLPVTEFMCEAVEQTLKHGYKTKIENGISTGQNSFSALSRKMDDLSTGDFSYASDTISLAEKVKEFILLSEFDKEKHDLDYYANLRSLIKFGHLTTLQASLLGSTIIHYQGQMAKMESVKAAQDMGNEFFGSIKERLPLKNLRVDSVWENQTEYGLQTKITMYDDKNRLFVWKASGGFEVKAGDLVNLVGTISRHETWTSKKLGKEMKENSLQRCKFHTPDEIDELIALANSPKPKRKAKVSSTTEDMQPSF